MLNKSIIALLGLLMLNVACAEQKSEGQQNSGQAPEVIRERLLEARPDLNLGEVRPSPIEGLYQVQVVGGPILYVTPKGDMMIAGDLLAIGPGGFSRVEDPYLVEKRQEALAALDPSESIDFKPEGETKAVVYVFTDVDCGYCRRLHQQIEAYRDGGRELPGYRDLGIEIRYLAYPRAGVNSSSGEKLVTAWCADDQQGTMDRLKHMQPVPGKSCDDHPVAKHFRLGADLGVSGTPALLMPDGRLVAGYLPPADLARMLELD
ncbi:DsbC family protein [Marinimicrobium sp. ABcell2]|uniref:DsbC family protein n=1 Tax=Marinimicrobium sp. ABcell2 TaxID=3069751 RepID=UPI0027AEC53E|nr:DsbC family protein [Marinimicrobium sp. ABcell2]MDQ2077304.1 DsbC family protein [Marinimicrobium sp. ABcell2]